MKIVYITNGMASTLHSSFELSRRLRQAGHEVIYVSPAAVEEQVAAQGFELVRITADQAFQAESEEIRRRAAGRPWALLRALAARRRVRERSVQNDEIERLVRRLAPDRLLIDIEMHFAILATAALGVPTLLPIVWFGIFRRQGLPPMHTELMPPSSWLERLGVELAWWRLRLSTLVSESRRRWARRLRGDLFPVVTYETFSIDDLEELARAKGARLAEIASRRHWLRPCLYRHLPVLCFNAWEMELPQEPHPNTHYVGPMVDRERREARLDADSRVRWARLVEERSTQPQPAPLIYASLGTVWSADVTFLRRVIRVFERRPDWRLVLGLGGKLDPEALAPVPENASLLRWAPQLEVLAEADCALTHGGITSINECVYNRVPMVVYSTQLVDQNGCAVRVAHHQLGVVGDKDKDSVEDIEKKIEHAVSDAAIRSNLIRMSQRYLECEQSNAAVRLIEDAGVESLSRASAAVEEH